MKISLNWLKKYVDIKIPNEELIRLIGSRLVEVEGVIDETHKYDNIYVVKVVQAEKIPDTHLTLCKIDVGEKDLVQVVCGAPNVREEMLAVWIKPGAVVPASVHEDAPFVIGKRKMLKKYDSNGMLAGADELDFDDKHEKIAEIDPKIAKSGDLLADVFDLRDQILEIENKSLTHRPDCFGMIGFAREVAGILGQSFKEPMDMNEKAEPQSKKTTALSIKIADQKICSRYTALVLEKHGEMQDKYLTEEQILIAKSGMRPIDPIVDATNYLMLLTGQPLHAFDYDKFVKIGKSKQPEIGVRLAKKGEKLLLLDDKEIELNENDIVITSSDHPVALAGAMGGKSTEIDANTRNIILESATFSLYNLRKTQMAHGIFSEAITRFTKGQSPCQTMAVADECAKMLRDGFEVTAVADDYPKPLKPIVVKITADEINELLGTEYSGRKISLTLENVGLKVTIKAGSPMMEVTVPAWRTDLHIKEDIIEEVGRLLGYDNIAPVLPLHQTAEVNKMMDLKKSVRETLRRLGANEVLTYSFISERILKKADQKPKNSYRIVNSISPDLQYVRQSIVPSLLDKAYVNQKIPFDRFTLFEMNKVYQKQWGMNEEGVPVEKTQLGLVLAERKNTGTAYYKAKRYLERMLTELKVEAIIRPLKEKMAMAEPFESKRAAEIVTKDGRVFGVVGEFKNAVRNEFKLAKYLAGFELDLEVLLQEIQPKQKIYLGEIEKRDLTVTTQATYAEVIAKIDKILEKYHLRARIMPIGIYQPKGKKSKNISVHLEFEGKITSKIMQELEKIS